MTKSFAPVPPIAALLLSLLASPWSAGGVAVARADAPSLSGGTLSLGKDREAPKYYGFALDFAIYDSSGLNGTYYANTIDSYFVPSWHLGSVFFRDTRFSKLTLAGRFVVTQPLEGYDPSYFSGGYGTGPITPCSNLTVSSTGTINPTQVQRCQYGTSFRTDYSDVRLTLRNPGIYVIPKAEISIDPFIHVAIPSSAQSRAASLRTSVSPGIGLSKVFAGKLALGYSLAFTKYFYRYNTKPDASNPMPTSDNSTDNATTNPDQGGVSQSQIQSNWATFLGDPTRAGTFGPNNPNFNFGHIFSIEVNPTDKLGISVLYILNDTYAMPVSDCNYAENGQVTNVCANGQAVAGASGSSVTTTGIRDTQVFWVSVNYQLVDWMAISASWITASSLHKDDGSLRQPFISTNADAFTTVGLGVSVTVEKAAARLGRLF